MDREDDTEIEEDYDEDEEIEEEDEDDKEDDDDERPPVKLIGQDGNAFAIIGACQRAARRAGWDKAKIDKIIEEMTSGDYNKVLCTAMNYFKVS